MIKTFILLLAVFMLNACGQKTIMTKPNLTQEEWQKDISQCEYESTSSTQNVDYGYRTIFGQTLDQVMRKNNLVKLCLKAMGYTPQSQANNQNSNVIQPETYDFAENESKINAKIPSNIEWGNIVPLNINIKDSNQIKSIKITIPSNPAEHQQALYANFNNPKVQQFISTRVRLAESDNGKILISVTNGNNEKYNKVYSVGKINNPANYQKESSLYSKFGKALPENSKIGFFKIRVDNDKLQVKTIIKHPMRPKIKDKESFVLNQVDFYFDKKHAVSIKLADGLSNNPYIGFGVKSAIESVKAVWKDSHGNEFVKSN